MKPLLNRTATLLSMHKKEQAIKPIMESLTGCSVSVRDDFNTDLFGTFTLEISRPGTQLDTAKLKALKAIEISGTDLGLASEGSFSPYPTCPFINSNRELVILVDLCNDMETIGESVSLETNFDQLHVSNMNDAIQFATKIGFPEHWLIANPEDIPHRFIKNIHSWQALEEAVLSSISQSPVQKAVLQTDMRAHANPTRMKNIMRATEDLAIKILRACPNCGIYGFALTSYKRGVPCEWCKQPTDMIMGEIYSCQKCKHCIELPREPGYADPGVCDLCNP